MRPSRFCVSLLTHGNLVCTCNRITLLRRERAVWSSSFPLLVSSAVCSALPGDTRLVILALMHQRRDESNPEVRSALLVFMRCAGASNSCTWPDGSRRSYRYRHRQLRKRNCRYRLRQDLPASEYHTNRHGHATPVSVSLQGTVLKDPAWALYITERLNIYGNCCTLNGGSNLIGTSKQPAISVSPFLLPSFAAR